MIRIPIEERFWSKVDRSGGPNACWPWAASRVGKLGYGQFHIPTGHRPSRPVLAHRFSLELKLGRPLASNEMARHSCDNPPCVNPAHLSVGTAVDNTRDMVARGRARTAGGESHPLSKLTADSVREMRRLFLAGTSKSQLSRVYGVTLTRVTLIVERRAWRSVT